MAFGSLKVEADEPGRRLVLAGGEFPAIPKRVVSIGGAVILLIFAYPAIGNLIALIRSGFTVSGFLDLVFSSFFPVAVVVLLLSAGRGVRLVSRLAFDRGKDRIEVTEFRLIGGSAREPNIIPFADLRGMTVGAGGRRSGRTGSQAVAGFPIKIKLLFREETGRSPRELTLAVDGLDKKEEAGDLGLRLASVAGFLYQRVVRNDPREIEIEFSTLGAPGFSPLPETVAKADYERDQVSQPAAALAARESTPSFDPASLKSDVRVATWQPGQEVRFHRPLGFAAIGCLPGLLFFAAGPLFFYSSGRTGTNTLGDQILIGFITGLFGLIFGAISATVVYTSLPRTIVFDWLERRLRVKGLFRHSEYDFSEIRSIEMKCENLRRSSSGSSSGYKNYSCDVIANLGASGGAAKALKILSTRADRDPDIPYRAALPLVTDLAKALGVARVAGNYD